MSKRGGVAPQVAEVSQKVARIQRPTEQPPNSNNPPLRAPIHEPVELPRVRAAPVPAPEPIVIDLVSDSEDEDVPEPDHAEPEDNSDTEDEEGVVDVPIANNGAVNTNANEQDHKTDEPQQTNEEPQQTTEKKEEKEENKMPYYMGLFEKLYLTKAEIRKFPPTVQHCLRVAHMSFDSLRIKGVDYPKESFILAADLLHKTKYLEVIKTMVGCGRPSNPKISEECLMLLIFTLSRIKKPTVGPQHFEKTEQLLRDLPDSHPVMRLLKIGKDILDCQPSSIFDFGYDHKSNNALFEFAEEIYDEIFERHNNVDIMSKVFLINIHQNIEEEGFIFPA